MGDSSERRYEKIRSHWRRSAENPIDQDGLKPTARDPYLQEVVESSMEKWIRKDMRLLDIGCGDGASTRRFATRAGRAVGVDYIDKYIECAERDSRGVENVSFMVGSVLDLSYILERTGKFSAVTTIRCLINLVDWSTQCDAIKQIAGALEPGGLYLISEGWQEGIDGLNLRRQRAGLEPLGIAEFNTMISRLSFETEIDKYFEVVAYENCGFYLFMSRVVQPVVTAPEMPRHDHPVNAAGARLMRDRVASEAFVDCDYAGVYVLRRR